MKPPNVKAARFLSFRSKLILLVVSSTALGFAQSAPNCDPTSIHCDFPEDTTSCHTKLCIFPACIHNLFATRHVDDPWYHISVPPYDRHLISRDTSLSDAQLSAIAESDERVIALKNAYPREILSPADVGHNTTYNSYQSLQSGHLFTPPSDVSAPSPVDAASNAPVAPSDAPTNDVASPTPSIDATAPTDASPTDSAVPVAS